MSGRLHHVAFLLYALSRRLGLRRGFDLATVRTALAVHRGLKEATLARGLRSPPTGVIERDQTRPQPPATSLRKNTRYPATSAGTAYSAHTQAEWAIGVQSVGARSRPCQAWNCSVSR